MDGSPGTGMHISIRALMLITAVAFIAVISISVIQSSDDSDAAVGDMFIEDGIKYEIRSDNTVFVAAGIEYSGIVSIPESVRYTGRNYSVIGIGDYAFFDCIYLTSVSMPGTISYIGNGAFKGCGSMISVVIPESVIVIGIDAFNGCSALTSVTIPEKVTYIGESVFASCIFLKEIIVSDRNTHYCSDDGILFDKARTTLLEYPAQRHGYTYSVPDTVVNIGSSSLDCCTNLRSIILHEGVETIGEYAFRGCTNLSMVTLPSTLRMIMQYAFSDCTSLTALTLPEGLRTIQTDAFYNCTSLISATIPKSVNSIGYSIFRGCTSLENIIVADGNPVCCSDDGVLFSTEKTILYEYPAGKKDSLYMMPDAVVNIWPRAFYQCPNTTSISFSSNLTLIETEAFYGCTSLSNVTLPNGLDRIDDGAFRYCTSLISASIGPGVSYLGEYVFAGCASLMSISVSDENLNYSSDSGVLMKKGGSLSLIQYPAGKADILYTIPEGVTTIENYAFENCHHLQHVIIPDTVTSIYYMAFYGCTSITSFDVSNLNTEYSSDSGVLFNKVKSNLIQYPLAKSDLSYVIPDTVYYVYGKAFDGCVHLRSLTIGMSVIYDIDLKDCRSLKEIIVSADNEHYYSINGVLFNKDLTQLIKYPVGKAEAEYTVPISVTSIKEYAFEGCTSLTYITIQKSVSVIERYAFKDCCNVGIIIVPSSVVGIYDGAFELGTEKIKTSCKAICTSGKLDPYKNEYTTITYSSGFTVSYDANGGSQDLYPEIVYGTYSLKGYDGTKGGYLFKGWSDGTHTYESGQTVEIVNDTTFTAVWEKSEAVPEWVGTAIIIGAVIALINVMIVAIFLLVRWLRY